MWDHLLATGESCLEFVHQSVSQVEEIQDKEGGIQDKEGGTKDAYNDCSQYSNRLENIDNQEAGFWQGFIEDVRGTIVPKSNLPNTIAQKSNLPNTRGQNATKGVKRKRRENDAEDMVFNVVQQHRDYIPMEELDGETSSNQGNMRGSSNEMR
ncbi:hypothetical protein L6452_08182 [Arctium lappa]|uniref:Uncharacterized protein n=1 Tax=Arctium lappa TaxID=4217 RepID=A0ACB9DH04_ARCLA|nr:hypothetical protein L6452_08182 [Arctium lappa]